MVDKSDLILAAIERVEAKICTMIEADLNGLKADFRCNRRSMTAS